MTLIPIERKKWVDTRPEGENCPKCNVPVRRMQISCPDSNPMSNISCLVMHYGWVCPKCGVQYQVEK